MEFTFVKYQGTGNDFVMIDNRTKHLSGLSTEQIALVCHRRFGIGADGFILIENDEQYDFKMVYYNSDGRESTMCGNGGRCSVRFARSLGIGSDEFITFSAIDGKHEASVDASGIVRLKMIDVAPAKDMGGAVFLDTGSPHHVQTVNNLAEFDIDTEGRKIRYDVYGEEGANVNFVEWDGSKLHVRTYERGVEAETYSCGTGVTASALSLYHSGQSTAKGLDISTPGGSLRVEFEPVDDGFEQVYLIGPAEPVFTGKWPAL